MMTAATTSSYNRKRQRLSYSTNNNYLNSNNNPDILRNSSSLNSKKQHFQDEFDEDIINLDSDSDDYVFKNEFKNQITLDGSSYCDMESESALEFIDDYSNDVKFDSDGKHTHFNQNIFADHNKINNNSSNNLHHHHFTHDGDENNDTENGNDIENDSYSDRFDDIRSDSSSSTVSYNATRHLSFLKNSSPISIVNRLMKKPNSKKKRTKSLPQLSYSTMSYSPALDKDSILQKIGEVQASLINHQHLNNPNSVNYTYQDNKFQNQKLLNRKMSFNNQSIESNKSSISSNTFSSTSNSNSNTSTSSNGSYDDKFLKSIDELEDDDDNVNCDDDDGHYVIKNGSPFANNRFIIKKLLGQGTFGKVIKAYDRKTDKVVAIKIIKSIHKYREASKIELRVLTMLKKHDPDNKFQCIHLRECFDYRNHICIVTDLLKISLYDFMEKNQFLSFPGSHIQAMARQLLRSVAFLHDLNLIHTDLKPENILLKDDSYVKKQYRKFDQYGRSSNEVCYRKILKDPKIYTIDFGSAIFQDEYHSSIVSTRHYRAPEIILGIGWSFPCDIWSIGCIFVELITGDALFRTHENEQHLAMMEKVLNEPIDLKIVRKCFNTHCSKKKYTNSNTRVDPTITDCFSKMSGRLTFPRPSTDLKLIREVEQMGSIEKIIGDRVGYPFDSKLSFKDSLSHFAITSKNKNDYHFWYLYIDLIKKMLVFDSSKRITAVEALNHKWFKYGIMDDGIN